MSDVCCYKIRKGPLHKVHLEVKAESAEVLPDTPPFDSCGYQVIFGTRIIGGRQVTTGEVPWTTAVLLQEDGLWKFQCSGSLIHPQVILTAAHCVYKYKAPNFSVRVGEIDNRADEEPLPHQDSLVDEVVVHPDFNPDTLKNDIALMFLSEGFRITPNVQVVCLLSGNVSYLTPNCHSGGYGIQGYGKLFTAKLLHKVEIPLVPKKDCVKKLRGTRLGLHFNLHRSFICAGGKKDTNTCRGDGGSALVCPMKNQTDRFVQVGIVSWGIGCGAEIPDVFVNVNMFRKWIDDHMLQRNFDLNVHRYVQK